VVDHIEYRDPPEALHQLFGLPDVWPVGEAFPQEMLA
jgi:hypothetical protein